MTPEEISTVRMSRIAKVGVISDTHGFLRPEAVAVLAGVERIIHAGDVGGLEILKELSIIAPVTVGRGNIDSQPWAAALPRTEIIEIGERSFYIIHDINDLDIDLKAAGIDMVVYGHSHRPIMEHRSDGVWYLNPGSAGPRRFSLPITIAYLEVSSTKINGEIINLET